MNSLRTHTGKIKLSGGCRLRARKRDSEKIEVSWCKPTYARTSRPQIQCGISLSYIVWTMRISSLSIFFLCIYISFLDIYFFLFANCLRPDRHHMCMLISFYLGCSAFDRCMLFGNHVNLTGVYRSFFFSQYNTVPCQRRIISSHTVARRGRMQCTFPDFHISRVNEKL